MKKYQLYLLITFFVYFVGCASVINVPFKVKSNPNGCPIEVNGVSMGITPVTIKLSTRKSWVGLMKAPDGWAYGYEQYEVTCLPPSNIGKGLTSQTKTITPRLTPKGGSIYFDLGLVPVNPTQKIEINSNTNTDSFSDNSERLKKLKQMREEGLINEDEYNKKRKEIIKGL